MAASQQFTRSLGECQGRISALRAKLETLPPTGRSRSEHRSSGFAGLHERVVALSPEDQPAVDASLAAIAVAARRLLHVLEGPDDPSRAIDGVGPAGRGTSSSPPPACGEVRALDR